MPLFIYNIKFPKWAAEAVLATVAGAVFLLSKYMERRQLQRTIAVGKLIGSAKASECPRSRISSLTFSSSRKLTADEGDAVLLVRQVLAEVQRR